MLELRDVVRLNEIPQCHADHQPSLFLVPTAHVLVPE